MDRVLGVAMLAAGVVFIVAGGRVSRLAVKARSDHFAGGVQEADRPLFKTVMVIVGIGWIGLGILKIFDLI